MITNRPKFVCLAAIEAPAPLSLIFPVCKNKLEPLKGISLQKLFLKKQFLYGAMEGELVTCCLGRSNTWRALAQEKGSVNKQKNGEEEEGGM